MTIKLKSSDGQIFEAPDNGCMKSNYIKKLIEGGKTDINLKEIKGEILGIIVEYLTYYSDKEFPTLPEILKTNDLKSEINEWDFSFIDAISYENTFHLINAGAELEIDHLYNLACLKIAAFMKGKSPEEVNEEFTIECQLTPEQAKSLGLDSS